MDRLGRKPFFTDSSLERKQKTVSKEAKYDGQSWQEAKIGGLPYFSAYKMEFFFIPKQSKNLDPSYKTDLDLWDCFGWVKLVL